MKKKLILPIFLLILGCSGQDNEEKKEDSFHTDKRYFQHLTYLLNLKNEVAHEYWADFSSQQLFLPIVYYTQDGTYVLNPNDHISSITDHEKKGLFQPNIPIIKLSNTYTDTINFQFSNSYSGDDRTALYYQENVLSFSSFELTQKFIPDIIDIQDWSIMVIHELFHAYQRSIPAHKTYFKNLDIPGGPDQFLGDYHKNLPWYKESVQQENDILKSIWKDERDISKGLATYDSLRDIRINRIQKEFEVNIREIEDYEIMIEGQARYMESLCKRYASNIKTDTTMLEEKDWGLITNMFQNYEVSNDKGLYNIYNNRYYYSLGYNISMILEKYLPNYKETIYFQEQSLNSYLEKIKAKESQ